MLIRALTLQDAPAYRLLRLRGFQEHPDAFNSSYEEQSQEPLSAMEKRIEQAQASPRECMLGAFDDAGAQMGAVALSVERRIKLQHKGWVYGMYVPQEHAGKGVGRALLVELIKLARQHGAFDHLHLTVTASNLRAVRLYESVGFVAGGTEIRAIKIGDQYYDKLHMALLLREI
jgi:RimJ/RimL family protein N-acetyltransferase